MEPFVLNKAENGVWYFSIPEFEKYGNIKTFFTTRVGGVSREGYNSLNFGGNTEDLPENVSKNRKRLYEAVGIDDFTEGFLKQIHSDCISCIKDSDIVSEKDFPIDNTDGIITNHENLLIVTLHADCLPLYLFDKVKKVIAVAHAGWRGTSKHIGPKTVQKMNEEFGCKPEDIISAVGPGIGKCCFEVGAEVYEEFKKSFIRIDECAEKKENEKYMLDLKKINKIQLEDAGVSGVLVSDYCTKCNEDILFSYRRDSGNTGRMGAGIILLKDE